MTLFGNQPSSMGGQGPFQGWRREMNDLFDRFSRNFEGARAGFQTISPHVEIFENDRTYHVSVEVPGIKEKDINVSLKDNQIIIEGQRKGMPELKEGEYCTTEFSYGDVYRVIPLDEEVNANTVKATYRDGILGIDLDKLESSAHKVKKIPILKS